VQRDKSAEFSREDAGGDRMRCGQRHQLIGEHMERHVMISGACYPGFRSSQSAAVRFIGRAGQRRYASLVERKPEAI